MEKNQKDSAEIEAKVLTFHQVKCVWNRKAQGIKGPLCRVGFSSLLFLVSTWWSVLVICMKPCDSWISLCESVLAFVLAVCQLFSWAARLGTPGSTCKEISVKPYYPSALTPSPHPPSLHNLPIHVVWLPGWLLCHLSSGLCFSEALQDIGRNTDLGSWNHRFLSQLGFRTWKSHPTFSSEVSLRSRVALTLSFWMLSQTPAPYFFLFSWMCSMSLSF